MEFDKLSEYADKAALGKETAFVLDQLDQIEKKGVAVAGVLKSFSVKLETRGTGTKEFIDEMRKLDTATTSYTNHLGSAITNINKLTDAQKKQIQINGQLSKSEADITKQKQLQLKTDQEVLKTMALEEKAEQEQIKTKRQLTAYEAELQKQRERGLKQQEAEARLAAQAMDEYTLLSKSLKDAEIRYRNLAIATGFQGEAQEEALQEALKIRGVLDKLDGNLRNYQRNVGNYKSAFDGLGMSFSQVARELPSLAISAQTFMLAISNNLPMVFDEVRNARQEIAALKAEGKETPGLFSRIAGSIFSLNVILSVVITLFTLFSKQIFGAIQGLFGMEDATEAAAEAADRLVQAQLRLIKTQKELMELEYGSRSGRDKLQNMELELKIMQSLNKSKGDQLALEEKIADQKYTNAFLAFQNDGYFTKLNEKQLALVGAELELNQLIRNQAAATSEDARKSYDSSIERAERRLELAKIEATEAKRIVDERFAAEEEYLIKQNELKAYKAEEARKIALQTALIESTAQIEANERVLNNEKSTLEQRLTAIRRIADERKKMALAEKKDTLNDPANTNADGTLTSAGIIAVKRYNAEILKIEKDRNVELLKIREEFRIRDLEAETEANRLRLDAANKLSEQLFKNEALSEEQRLSALQDSVNARRQILENDFRKTLSTAGISDADIAKIKENGYFQIANKKITDAELLKLTKAYFAGVKDIGVQAYDEMLEVTKDYYQKEVELTERALIEINSKYDKIIEDRSDTYNSQIVSLNNLYAKGKISAEKYAADRKKIEFNSQKELLKLEIDRQQAVLKAMENSKSLKLAIERELVERQKEFLQATTDDEKVRLANRIKALKDELKAVEETLGKETALYKQLSAMIKSLSDLGISGRDSQIQQWLDDLQMYEKRAREVFAVIESLINMRSIKERNRLQEERDMIDRNTAAQIRAVELTTLSEQDKAAKIAIINAKAQAQKDQIAIRERAIQMQQARFDKAMAIFNIMLATARNIAEARTPFGKVIAAVSGAAQLAIAIATPLPKFRKGLQRDYEGPGWVGDGGKKEALVRKTGNVEITPDKDTLVWINKGDRIYPDAEEYIKGQGAKAVNKSSQMAINAQGKLVAYVDDAVKRELKEQTSIMKQLVDKPVPQLDVREGTLIGFYKTMADRYRYMNDSINW